MDKHSSAAAAEAAYWDAEIRKHELERERLDNEERRLAQLVAPLENKRWHTDEELALMGKHLEAQIARDKADSAAAFAVRRWHAAFQQITVKR